MENQEIPKIKLEEEAEETDEITEEEKPKISQERLDVAKKKTKKMNELMEQAGIEENEDKLEEAGRLKEEIEKIMEGGEGKEILEKLFDEQKQKLFDLGYPEALGMNGDDFSAKHIEPLRKELDKVPENIPEGNLPFLIVIPTNIIDLKKKMSMVKSGQKTGFVWEHFDFKKLKNVEDKDIKKVEEIETFEYPYLIFDIKNGANNIGGISANDCVKQFTKENRRGLTIQEGIDLVTHYPEILQGDCHINLPGSWHGSRHVPLLSLRSDRPELSRTLRDNAYIGWGSASCKKENNSTK